MKPYTVVLHTLMYNVVLKWNEGEQSRVQITEKSYLWAVAGMTL